PFTPLIRFSWALSGSHWCCLVLGLPLGTSCQILYWLLGLCGLRVLFSVVGFGGARILASEGDHHQFFCINKLTAKVSKDNLEGSPNSP
ncbi:unnamed protein product, partial [Prunus brigantina]